MDLQCVQKYYEQCEETLAQARLLLLSKAHEVIELQPGEVLKISVDLDIEVSKELVPECMRAYDVAVVA